MEVDKEKKETHEARYVPMEIYQCWNFAYVIVHLACDVVEGCKEHEDLWDVAEQIEID